MPQIAGINSSSTAISGRSQLFSIIMMEWHKPCIECWGSRTSTGIWSTSRLPYGLRGGIPEDRVLAGYEAIPFIQTIKYTTSSSGSSGLSMVAVKGIPMSGISTANMEPVASDNHPLVKDWQGQPLDKFDKK